MFTKGTDGKKGKGKSAAKMKKDLSKFFVKLATKKQENTEVKETKPK